MAMKLLHLSLWYAGLLVTTCGQDAPPIYLDVPGGRSRCISNAVLRHETNTVFYKIKDSGLGSEDAGKVSAKIVYPSGKTERRNPGGGEPEKHVMREDEDGVYSICFSNRDPKNRARVEVRESRGWSSGADKTTDLQPIEESLRFMKDMAIDIKNDLTDQLDWEKDRNSEHESLRSRINMLAGFTMMILVSVSGWQLLLLNRFFRSKKLI